MMKVFDNITGIAGDVEAVITSYNQGEMLREAVQSVYGQTVRPAGITIVDDGSADEESVRILREIEADTKAPVPVQVIWQENRGVSAARNAGIRNSSGKTLYGNGVGNVSRRGGIGNVSREGV